MTLTYSDTKPKTPGKYWVRMVNPIHRCQSQQIVDVHKAFDGLRFYMTLPEGDRMLAVDNTHGYELEWAGPLPVPDNQLDKPLMRVLSKATN